MCLTVDFECGECDGQTWRHTLGGGSGVLWLTTKHAQNTPFCNSCDLDLNLTVVGLLLFFCPVYIWGPQLILAHIDARNLKVGVFFFVWYIWGLQMILAHIVVLRSRAKCNASIF